MNKSKKNSVTSIVVIIVLLLTAAVYLLLPYNKEKTDAIVFFCIIVAEILSYINLLFYNRVSDRRKLALAAGGYTITAIYFVCSAATAFLFGIYYRNAILTYEILVSVLTAFFIIASVLIYLGGRKAAEENREIESACSFFKNLEYKAESLYADAKNEKAAKELQRIQDAIKSCDQSKRVETDCIINQSMDVLRALLEAPEPDTEKVTKLSGKIICLIKQRNTEVSQLKMGGI